MTRARPKILFYTTQVVYPFWGGSEKFWYECLLQPELHSEFDCQVMLPDSPVTRARGNTLRSLGVSVKWYTKLCPNSFNRIAFRLRQEILGSKDPEGRLPRFDEIHRYHPELVWFSLASIGDWPAVEYAVSLCHAREVPYWLVVLHTPEHFFVHDPAGAVRFEGLIEGAKRVVFIAERNRRTLDRTIGRPLKNAWMTVNALDHSFLERAASVSESHPVRVEGTVRLLNLARFDPQAKGQHVLLEALSGDPWRGRDWQLTLLGSGQSGRFLERLLRLFGVESEKVRILEDAPDVLAVLAESDLLVLSSLSEGMPYALIEAMASGRPAVATPVGGMPELIIEGETGWLARSSEPADVSDALARAWTDRRQWPAFGARAIAKVNPAYRQDRMMFELISALREDTHHRVS